MYEVQVSCPKCGNLCESKGFSGLAFFIILLVCSFLAVITFGLGIIIAIIINFAISHSIKKAAKEEPINCKSCGFRFIP